MSTKIYDAYKLSGKYDIVSLNTALSDLRQQVTKQCENLIANIVVRQFLSMYYMTLLHGTNTPADTDTVTTTTLEKIAQQDMKSAWAYLYCKIKHKSYKQNVYIRNAIKILNGKIKNNRDNNTISNKPYIIAICSFSISSSPASFKKTHFMTLYITNPIVMITK